VFGALGEQPVEIHLVDALGREDGFRDALGGVLIEVDVGGAEGEVEVGHHHLGLEQRGHGPGQIVGHGGGADAALGADEGDGAAHRLGSGSTKMEDTT